ncbi:hypothetical protein BU23DRAFT_462333 [Bimuria novae-zelandiae CBS 107.79]|uniref:DUF6536 domain-containing protein n=1 Tax=Bimuria novae-zelandiae CBS 107.79 TaxID=1447943 RepID=A0A6A5VDS9_9PLEO|nr:hypothetical protein BU23DRAFT_462333 [Bimuria novae-zelandiae CBS 107.79]
MTSSDRITEDGVYPVSSSRRSSQASLVSAASSQTQTQIQTDSPVQQLFHSIKTCFQSRFQELEALTQNRLKRSRFYGWRMGVLFGSCMSIFVLCCNIAVVVIGSIAHSGYQNGIANVMYGEASSISRWSTFFHLLINAASTVLLASSNYTMQVLCSPTRDDIDTAHARGMWVDIGLLSFRNLKAIPRKRAALALVLAFSSVPLHLFYNAAVFQIATYNEHNITIIEHGSHAYDTLVVLSDDTQPGQTFRNLSNAQWKQIYGTKFVADHGDLFLSIDRMAFNTSNLPTAPNTDHFLPLYIEKSNQEIIHNLTIESADWIRYNHSTGISVDEGIPVSMSVKLAFAKIIEPHSRIQTSLYFMVTVIAFNLLKLAIMLRVLFTDRQDYIVTLGDALATFLKHPDPVTHGKCMYGKEEMMYYLGHASHYAKGEEKDIEEYFSARLAGTWLPQPKPYFAFITYDRQVFLALL